MKTGIILFKTKEECCGCSACFSICPKQAIIMIEDEEGFDYPLIDNNKCIRCKLCLKICPMKMDKTNIYH